MVDSPYYYLSLLDELSQGWNVSLLGGTGPDEWQLTITTRGEKRPGQRGVFVYTGPLRKIIAAAHAGAPDGRY